MNEMTKSPLATQKSYARKSGVELLKVFAILLICMSHCVQTLEDYADFSVPTENIQLLILKILRFDGNFGNVIFVICSSYFLLKSTRAKKEKAVGLLLDSQAISITIFAGLLILGLNLSIDMDNSFKFYAGQLFPDMYEEVWFVPNYVMLYMIHPLLNRIIDSMGQKKHFAVCLFIIVFQGIASLFGAHPVFSNFIGFVYVYLLVAYMSIYCGNFMKDKKKNVLVFLLCSVSFLAIVIAKNYLGLNHKFFENYPSVSSMLSIVTLPIFISLFNLAVNSSFKSRFINYLSSCSLFVYCIHENYLIRMILRPAIYEALIEMFGENKLVIYAFVMFCFVVISAFVAAVIYKATLHKLTAKISVALCNISSKAFNKIYSHFEIKPNKD